MRANKLQATRHLNYLTLHQIQREVLQCLNRKPIDYSTKDYINNPTFGCRPNCKCKLLLKAYSHFHSPTSALYYWAHFPFRFTELLQQINQWASKFITLLSGFDIVDIRKLFRNWRNSENWNEARASNLISSISIWRAKLLKSLSDHPHRVTDQLSYKICTKMYKTKLFYEFLKFQLTYRKA